MVQAVFEVMRLNHCLNQDSQDLETISKPSVAYPAVSLHYAFTPTLTLSLRGEGINE